MSALQPIESVQLGDRTFNSIRQAIISGELAPGQPLRDRVLAQTLGVSRTPVREALYRLEHGALVTSQGRSGWIVAAFTEQDIRELFELRRALEPLGLDKLERDGDDRAVEDLSTFFGEFSHPVPEHRFDDYFVCDHAFHKRIVSCSGNERLTRFYGVIEDQIDRGRHFLSTTSVGRVDANLDEHLAISSAVANRDFARARAELIHHLDMGEQLMLDHVQRRTESS